MNVQNGKTTKILLAAIMLFALVSSLVWFQMSKNHPLTSNEPCYDGLAYQWVHGHAGMSRDGKTPSSFTGPAYPAFVAICYRFFGRTPQYVYLFQIGFWLLSVYMTFRIGLMVSRSRFVSLLAAGLLTLYLPLMTYAPQLYTEVPFTMLMALSTWLLLLAFQKKSALWFLYSGLMIGLTGLCRPIIMVTPAIVLAIMFMLNRKQLKFALLSFAMLVLGSTAVVMPWTIRNYVAFHTFIPIASEGGHVLYSGNYNDGLYDGNWQFPAYVQKYLLEHPSEADANRFEGREAIKIIKNDPGHFAKLTWLKFLRLWFNLGYPDPPSKTTIALALAHAIVLLLAFIAIPITKERFGLNLILSQVLVFTVVHSVFYACARYIMPLMPYLFILSVAGAARVLPPVAKLKRRFDEANA